MIATHSILWEDLQVFWLTWDTEITFGILWVGGSYYLVRWLLWRFPDFFYKRNGPDRP